MAKDTQARADVLANNYLRCPSCDRMLTRVAVLVSGLRKAATAAHVRLKHPGTFETCSDDDCSAARYAIDVEGV